MDFEAKLIVLVLLVCLVALTISALGDWYRMRRENNRYIKSLFKPYNETGANWEGIKRLSEKENRKMHGELFSKMVELKDLPEGVVTEKNKGGKNGK